LSEKNSKSKLVPAKPRDVIYCMTTDKIINFLNLEHVITPTIHAKFFFGGSLFRIRVMTFLYGASRLHSLDTPHSVGLLWTSDQPDAETST